MIKTHSLILLVCVLIALMPAGCRKVSEEERIRALIQQLTRLAEKQDAPALLNLMADEYVDGEGRNKQQTADMLEEYFSRFHGIVIHLLSSRVNEIRNGRAEVESEGLISSGAAEALRKLIRFAGECYRFHFRLVRRGQTWLVASAEWQEMDAQSLFPESLKILRELFPNF